MPLTVEQVSVVLLYMIFERSHNTDGPFRLGSGALMALVRPHKIGGSIVTAAISELRSDNRINFSSEAGGVYEISAAGLKFVEQQLSDLRSATHSALRALLIKPIVVEGIPASDRTVTLDHNSESYKEAVRKVEETIATLSKANDIGELLPGEQATAVSALTEGKKLLAAKELRWSSVQAFLIPKLRWIADKAAGSLVGKFAIGAIEAIIRLFG